MSRKKIIINNLYYLVINFFTKYVADFENDEIQETTHSNLEIDSNLSGIKATSSSEESLDAFDAAILKADKFLKSVNKYPNNVEAMSKVVDNADSNEQSRAKNNSSGRSSRSSIIETDIDINMISRDNVDLNQSRANNNSSGRSSRSSIIETDIDINMIPRDNFDQKSNNSLNFISKINLMASTSKMKSLLPSNSHLGHKRPRQSDSESEFIDTAFIIVPSVKEIVDPSYSYMVSDDNIQSFIKTGKMLMDDSIVNAYDPAEIDEIITDEIILGIRFYLVKWKNWSKGFNTWERYGSLYKSQKLLLKYIESKNKRVDGHLHPIDGTLLMMSRKMITMLFETFKTESGISLPAFLPEDINGLFNSLDVGTENSQKYKNRSLQYFLSTIVLSYLRQRQLCNFRQWEIEINVVTRDIQIKIENNMDLEGPPNSFIYISEYVPQAKIIISDDPPIGCNCKKNCKIPENCCYEMTGCLKAYDKNKNIIVNPGHPVYECNKKCKCSSACTNRVVQLGSNVNVCVYKTRRTGWGVKSSQNIQKGQFVARYIGEIITVEEFEDRLRNGLSSIDYTWNLDFNDPQNYKYVIDGTQFANFTRFINHSCSSNLNVYAVWINCLDRNLPQLALFANRDIVAGEQLTTNYFSRVDKSTLKKTGIRCRCDMRNCNGYYF